VNSHLIHTGMPRWMDARVFGPHREGPTINA